uniref:Uncharacterized protein n=1 Tax=Zea mays TaxID=4577 RepID=B4FCI8_MAIZE|nr:unknown [Zea mays]
MLRVSSQFWRNGNSISQQVSALCIIRYHSHRIVLRSWGVTDGLPMSLCSACASHSSVVIKIAL